LNNNYKLYALIAALAIAPSPVFAKSHISKPAAKSAAVKADSIKRESWGKFEGKPVYQYTLVNKNGAVYKITNYGARNTAIIVPDAKGKLGDVVLGYDNLAQYRTNTTFFGSVPGRYANRIAGGKLTLDGHTYKLSQNDGKNTLHGGANGFFARVWDSSTSITPDGPSVKLTLVSKDGDQGFPGKVTTVAVFTWRNDNSVKIDLSAVTTKKTVVNLTDHPYFNLTGAGSPSILNHVLKIDADSYTPIDAHSIPFGKIADVAGTPLDFTTPHKIGERINAKSEQLSNAKGYDHNFVIRHSDANEDGLTEDAVVTDPTSGRELTVYSDQPGIQFYSGNFLTGTEKSKGGKFYPKRSAFCLEPQDYPDAPHQPSYPSAVLAPGQTYHATIVYKFSTVK